MNNMEDDYGALVGSDHIRRYGQFFTDSRIAEFMVRWVLSSARRDHIFDPCFGLGAFYSATLAVDPGIKYHGCELDDRVLGFWRRNSNEPEPILSNCDYLTTWNGNYDNIVCNPPYMRFQKFLSRGDIMPQLEAHLGIRLSGYTNVASAFLMKSLHELRCGGRLAYIMPLEFLNTGYGRVVKEALLRDGRLHAILKLECEKDAFPEVTTSVGILLCDSASVADSVRFVTVSDLNSIAESLQLLPSRDVAVCELDPSDKWLKYFSSNSLTFNQSRLVPLATYGRFVRGIATGANSFFVGPRAHFRARGISEEELVPCLSKSALIKQDVFTDFDLDDLAESGASVYLFSPRKDLSTGAKHYIEDGERNGFHLRFLTKCRTPWYKAEFRNPAPILLGVFSRNGYKVVRNMSKAVNLTCFHGFYPNLIGCQFVDSLFQFLLSDTGRSLLGLSMRKYGDSLDKFEPNDLNEALVPSPEVLDRFNTKLPFPDIRLSSAHADKFFREFLELEQTVR